MKFLNSIFNFNVYSLRARIALVLILSLVITTAVLYRLNQRAEQFIIEDVEQQRSELAEAIKVAQQSLTSSQYAREFLKKERERETRESHVRRILVVNARGIIEDSSDADDIERPFNELGFGSFEKAIDLNQQHNYMKLIKQDLTYTFPIYTRTASELDKASIIYIIIIFTDDLAVHLKESSFNRLLATGGMLFAAILVTLLLILEFTRPVGKLARAARQVAAGNFEINLPVKRPDELGQLIMVFNDMVKGLKERRALEARLYRAEQSAIVGRLASGIAHEIKNPLNYISLTIDYLRGKYAPAVEDAKEKYVEKMDNIKEEIKRLDRLIRNFLSYGRPLELKLKSIELRDLIKSIFDLTADQAEQQSIHMSMTETGSIPAISADLERLRSCFSNIVINAQQAMSNGGELKVDLQAKNNGVAVIIADTGSGIAPENMEKVFEPYFSTKDTGTGLGLALVKRIIEGHGGQITVGSTVSVGTTFYIWLPAHPPQADQSIENNSLNQLATLPI